MPVIINIILTGSRSTYMIWLTYQLHNPTVQMFFRWLFCFSKVKQKVSLIWIDQAHEQNNAVIKGMGGVTLVLNKDDESGLAWWELCLHALSLIINEDESKAF